VVVIDALDECEQDGKNEILLCIQHHFVKLPGWFRVFVATMPEIPVLDKLKKFSPKYIEPDEEHKQESLDNILSRVVERISFRCLTWRQQPARPCC
jgi:hypothetical protein